LLVVFSAVAGCEARGNALITPPVPAIQILAELEDGTTNAGQGPFKVSYFGYGRTLDDATLGQLSARLSLRTWPEGAAVATSLTIGQVASANTNVPANSASVALTPRAALDDRWYSLQFGSAPQPGVISVQSFDGGVPGVRLRPGSHPAMRLMEFCQASVPGDKFIVVYSEPVTSTNLMLTVTQNGAPLTCRVDSSGGQDVHEFCGTLVLGPLTVTLAAGDAQGAGGVPLPSGSWSFDSSKLPVVESGCVGYLVPP
jgi:hypothetical protein